MDFDQIPIKSKRLSENYTGFWIWLFFAFTKILNHCFFNFFPERKDVMNTVGNKL